MPIQHLNQQAVQLATFPRTHADRLRVTSAIVDGVTLLDFGVRTEGGLEAGLVLARLCMADSGEVRLAPPDTAVAPVPQVFVHTDHPIETCLLSQYAGWKIATDDYFAMASGPMRALARSEPIFDHLPDIDDYNATVGILESGKMPTPAAIDLIHAAVGRDRHLILAVAPTASQAGNLQIVARSVETAMHKLHELKFPLGAVVSGSGSAPLPPVAANDLDGIGRTNDAILYGATVNLWVRCEDALLETIGPKVPSCASAAHGQLFANLFKAANHDFYALDPALFSPAVVIFHNLQTGHSFRFGAVLPELLRESFGV